MKKLEQKSKEKKLKKKSNSRKKDTFSESGSESDSCFECKSGYFSTLKKEKKSEVSSRLNSILSFKSEESGTIYLKFFFYFIFIDRNIRWI
jgi:hypothetical protein